MEIQEYEEKKKTKSLHGFILLKTHAWSWTDTLFPVPLSKISALNLIKPTRFPNISTPC